LIDSVTLGFLKDTVKVLAKITFLPMSQKTKLYKILTLLIQTAAKNLSSRRLPVCHPEKQCFHSFYIKNHAHSQDGYTIKRERAYTPPIPQGGRFISQIRFGNNSLPRVESQSEGSGYRKGGYNKYGKVFIP